MDECEDDDDIPVYVRRVEDSRIHAIGINVVSYEGFLISQNP